MRRIHLALTAAIAVAAVFAAPASAADPDLVERALWAVKCIGDSLGGNACVGP